MVPALVYIDNYDEVLDTVEEVKKSLLVALVDRKVTKFFASIDGLVMRCLSLSVWESVMWEMIIRRITSIPVWPLTWHWDAAEIRWS